MYSRRPVSLLSNANSSWAVRSYPGEAGTRHLTLCGGKQTVARYLHVLFAGGKISRVVSKKRVSHLQIYIHAEKSHGGAEAEVSGQRLDVDEKLRDAETLPYFRHKCRKSNLSLPSPVRQGKLDVTREYRLSRKSSTEKSSNFQFFFQVARNVHSDLSGLS